MSTMESSGLDSDSSTCDKTQSNNMESRAQSIQRCIKYLVHACHCRDAKCRIPSCQKMKKVVEHTKGCKQKLNSGCPICRQLIALCCYHAKHCQETKCSVPFCAKVKLKLKHRQLQQRYQERGRIANIQNRTMASAALQMNAGNSNAAIEPFSGVQPAQPGVGLKPSTGPPVGALQAVQQVQAAAVRQTAPHMVVPSNYGNNNPVVSPPVANTALPVSTANPVGNATLGSPQVMPSARPSLGGMQGPAWEQLLQTLKSPSSLQQQAQVINIMKSNPQLIAAFLQQRTAQQQRQQQNQQLQQNQQQMLQQNQQQMLQQNQQQMLQPNQQMLQPNQQQMLDSDSSTCDKTQSNNLESRALSIQRGINYLVHACHCRDANCRLPSCQKMKKIVQHTKGCKQELNSGCPICRQLIALCCYHAKHCQESECSVPFCAKIKMNQAQQAISSDYEDMSSVVDFLSNAIHDLSLTEI